jgi:hypothetical protein
MNCLEAIILLTFTFSANEGKSRTSQRTSDAIIISPDLITAHCSRGLFLQAKFWSGTVQQGTPLLTRQPSKFMGLVWHERGDEKKLGRFI